MEVLIIQKTLIYAIPLLIVALGGMFAERSGVINLALEGQMIFGALVGAIFVCAMLENGIMVESQQLLFVLAILVAGISGAIFSLLLSFSAVTLKADQTIGGTALNMLAPALVCTLGLAFYRGEKISMPPTFNFVIKNPDVSKFWQIFVDKGPVQ